MTRLYVAAVATFLLAGTAFLPGQVFRIREIECTTQYGPCESKYLQVLDTLRNRPLLFAPLPETLPFAEVKEVKFARRLPFTLAARIVLRRNVGGVVTGSSELVWLVDEDGGVVGQTGQTTLPVVEVDSLSVAVGDKVEPEVVAAFGEMARISEERLVGRLTGKTLSVRLPTGIAVLLDLANLSEEWVDALHSIIEGSRIGGKLPGTIDLRYKSPIVTYHN